jgi:hypothetical protein
MADPKKGGDAPQPLQEENILSRLRSGASQTPAGLTSYVGLLGRSSKEGKWLLYLTLDMSRHVEIREEDIVHSEQLPPERSPFGTLGGTRVFVKKGAQVTSTRTVSRSYNAGEDDFDLDVQLGAASVPKPKLPCEGTGGDTTCAAECPGPGTGDAQTCLTCVSCQGTCGATCHTCRTDCGATCDTCKTQCGQPTCQTCHTHCGTCQTCHTNCGTCQTCATQCGTCQTQCNQATCHTCQTQCQQHTCVTCRTECATCPGDTCVACTHVTCFKGCVQG